MGLPMDWANLRFKKYLLNACFIFVIIPLSTSPWAATPITKINLYNGIQRIQSNKGALYLSSEETDTFTTGHTDNDFTSGIGIALMFPYANRSPCNYSIGIDLLFFDTSNIGRVKLYGLPQFDNYQYHLRFRTARVMLDGNFDLKPLPYHLIPFIKGGIGAAKITTDYLETPNGSDIVGGNLHMPDMTTYNFAYSIGAGVKHSLSETIELALLYLYTNLGTVHSSRYSNNGDTQVTLLKPISAKLNTNSIYMELTWLIK
jgi:opacity protein-like surface antigen